MVFPKQKVGHTLLVRRTLPNVSQVRHFDKYSRKGGRWSWKRPSYERGVVSLVKTERRIEEGIASALTEVEAVEAGLRYKTFSNAPSSRGRCSM